MNLPTHGSIQTEKLEDFLPEAAAITLKRELYNWMMRAPERLKDEASIRYIWMSVLERHGLECPHPYRTELRAACRSGAFECRLCRAWHIPTLKKT